MDTEENVPKRIQAILEQMKSGDYYIEIGQYNVGFIHFQKDIDYLKSVLGEINEDIHIAARLKFEWLIRVSKILKDTNKPQESLQLQEKILEFAQSFTSSFERFKDENKFITPAQVSSILNDISCSLRRMKKFKRSTMYLKRSLAFENRHRISSGMTLTNLGANYLSMGIPATAVKYTDQAVEELSKDYNNNPSRKVAKLLAIAYLNSSMQLYSIGKKKSAAGSARKGIKVLDSFEGFATEHLYSRLMDFALEKAQVIENVQRTVIKRATLRKKEMIKQKQKVGSLIPLNKYKGNNKIPLDLSTGVTLHAYNDISEIRNKIFYVCDDYSKEEDKQMGDQIVFSRPVKKFRKSYFPYRSQLADEDKKMGFEKSCTKNKNLSSISSRSAVQHAQKVESDPFEEAADLLDDSWQEDGDENAENEEFRAAQASLAYQLCAISEEPQQSQLEDKCREPRIEEDDEQENEEGQSSRQSGYQDEEDGEEESQSSLTRLEYEAIKEQYQEYLDEEKEAELEKEAYVNLNKNPFEDKKVYSNLKEKSQEIKQSEDIQVARSTHDHQTLNAKRNSSPHTPIISGDNFEDVEEPEFMHPDFTDFIPSSKIQNPAKPEEDATSKQTKSPEVDKRHNKPDIIDNLENNEIDGFEVKQKNEEFEEIEDYQQPPEFDEVEDDQQPPEFDEIEEDQQQQDKVEEFEEEEKQVQDEEEYQEHFEEDDQPQEFEEDEEEKVEQDPNYVPQKDLHIQEFSSHEESKEVPQSETEEVLFENEAVPDFDDFEEEEKELIKDEDQVNEDKEEYEAIEEVPIISKTPEHNEEPLLKPSSDDNDLFANFPKGHHSRMSSNLDGKIIDIDKIR